MPTKLITEESISMPEWSPSAKTADECEKTPTAILTADKTTFAKIDNIDIFSFIFNKENLPNLKAGPGISFYF